MVRSVYSSGNLDSFDVDPVISNLRTYFGEEANPVIQYIKAHRSEGDNISNVEKVVTAFRAYAKDEGLSEKEIREEFMKIEFVKNTINNMVGNPWLHL